MEDELIFESSLTEAEIKKNFENVDLFTEVMHSLEDALAFEQGKVRHGTVSRKRSLSEVDIAAERKALHMTQKKLCDTIGYFASYSRSVGDGQQQSFAYGSKTDLFVRARP